MARRARLVSWNGKDVRPELREFPAGRYVKDLGTGLVNAIKKHLGLR